MPDLAAIVGAEFDRWLHLFRKVSVAQGWQIEKGQFVCIVGPSGCGKSTLLKIIAGLDFFTSGEFAVRHGEGKDQPINNVVFQEYAIFPWRTVLENVAFGLEMRSISKKIRIEIARKWLQKVGLSKFANYLSLIHI